MAKTTRIANASQKLVFAALLFGATTAAHALTTTVTTGSFSSQAGAFTVDFGVSPINNAGPVAGNALPGDVLVNGSAGGVNPPMRAIRCRRAARRPPMATQVRHPA